MSRSRLFFAFFEIRRGMSHRRTARIKLETLSVTFSAIFVSKFSSGTAMNKPLGQALQIVILGCIVLAGIAVYVLQFFNQDPALPASQQRSVPLVVLFCLAGTVGGIANNFRRLQRLSTHNWQELDSTTRWLMTIQIYVSPVIGALFAFVLNLAFMAELVQSAMFPDYETADKYKNFVQFAESTLPLQNVDVAKAIFWSFVAGFAEQFVPNFIDKVAKESDNTANQKTNSPRRKATPRKTKQ